MAKSVPPSPPPPPEAQPGRRKSAELPPLRTLEEEDKRMLQWLRKQIMHFAEEGGNRNYGDFCIARIAKLIEDQKTVAHAVITMQDAHKLALSQMQFAQSVVRQLERRVEQAERAVQQPEQQNGNNHPEPEPEFEDE